MFNVILTQMCSIGGILMLFIMVGAVAITSVLCLLMYGQLSGEV